MQHNLRNIPFFSDLSDDVLETIARRLRREHYHKGATVVTEDEPGDCMYLIESGQVKVVSEKSGQEKLITYLGPGNFFGETALLLTEKRTASVKVVLDADLLMLSKDDLNELLEQHPAIALTISRELSRRLGRSTQTPVQREEFNIVATVGPSVPRLARFIAEITGEDVFLFDLGGLSNVTLDQAALAQSQVFLVRGGDALDAESLPGRLSTLVEQYYWVLLSVAPYEMPLTLKALELADITVTLGTTAKGWIKNLAPKGYWHADENDKALRHLARKIAQRQVGIALSSGNARGMAHIGVLEVLENEGIPIDMIAGTSAGAVFGGLYASGRTVAEMKEFAAYVQKQYNFFSGFRFWDIRFPPRSGAIKGDAVLNYFRKWTGDKTFDDLAMPLYVVATDVISGEEIVFDRGLVAEAMRASMSVIGVFEPAHIAGRFLIDGGSVNPVPTQLLADKGMDIVIASNVIPTLEDRLHRREQKREGRAPGAIGIVMGAMEIMESEIIKTRMGSVNVLVQPDVARFGTSEYDKFQDLIRSGEEAAWQQVPHIRQLLAPRPRAPLRR